MARSSSNRKSASVRGELGLADTGRPEEQERADRPVAGRTSPARERRIALATAATASSWPMTRSCSTSSMRTSFCHLAFHEPADGDAGPLGDDLGDVLLVDLFLQHLAARPGGRSSRDGLHLDLGSSVAHRAVAELSGLLEVALALGLARRRRGCSSRSLSSRISAMASFSFCQCATIASRSSRAPRARLRSRRAARFDAVVGLLRERRLLDLELADAPLDDVDLERHRVDLDAQARRRLVDEVDRLVGQLAGR